MTYRKSLHSRLRRLENVEHEIDVNEVNRHLRTGEKVKRVNRDMANRLSGFFNEAYKSNVSPVPFEDDEPYAYKKQDPPCPSEKSG